MFSNSCLLFNLNYYKFVVLDVHTLLFSIEALLSSETVVKHLIQRNIPEDLNLNQHFCEKHKSRIPHH